MTRPTRRGSQVRPGGRERTSAPGRMRPEGRRPAAVRSAALCLGCAAGALLILSGGCVGPWTAAPVPVPTVQLAPMPAGSDCLLVLLPGRGDRASVFGHSSFAQPVADAGVRAGVVAADLHVGYYVNRTAEMRLHEDVVVPAKARGVSEIWLVGVSLGGLGALAYDRFHPGEVSGIVLLAPFLGEDEVIDEVASGGGLPGWQPRLPLAPDDWQRNIWLWLKRFARPGPDTPELVLGWGSGDALAPSCRLLADVLPADRTFVVPGSHDWSVWRRLWREMLASGRVAPRCR